MKKFIVLIIIGASIVTTLVGCKGNDTANAAETDKPTINQETNMTKSESNEKNTRQEEAPIRDIAFNIGVVKNVYPNEDGITLVVDVNTREGIKERELKVPEDSQIEGDILTGDTIGFIYKDNNENQNLIDLVHIIEKNNNNYTIEGTIKSIESGRDGVTVLLSLEDRKEVSAIISIVQTQLRGDWEQIKEGNKIILKGTTIIDLDLPHYVPEIVELIN